MKRQDTSTTDARRRTPAVLGDRCVEELELVNYVLAHEVEERRKLTAELAASNDALSGLLHESEVLKRCLSETHDELHESEARAARSRHHSLHDALTGLPNATLFRDRLQLALAQARRHGWRLAVMFVDIDKFKVINDTHGHDLGDRVLRTVGERLQASVRAGDTVSRRGGDEFLLLMPEAKDERNAERLAAKLVAAIARESHFDGLALSVQSSIGVAVYPEDGESSEELLRNADLAMYAAKQARTGTVLFSHAPPAPGHGPGPP